MTDLDLIGEQVVSKHYGVGTIQKFGDGKVDIVFESTSQLRTFTLKAFDARDGEPPLKCVNSDAGQYIQGILDGPLPPPPPLPSPKKRRLFYVFQGVTYEQELTRQYLSAPYTDKQYVHHWERMSEVRPGDIILHGALHGHIVAISEALECANIVPMPKDDYRRKYGSEMRRIEIHTCLLVCSPINTADYKDIIIKLCRGKTGMPFNKNGGGNQGYLFDLPKKLGAVLIKAILSQNKTLTEEKFIQDIVAQMKADSEYGYDSNI